MHVNAQTEAPTAHCWALYMKTLLIDIHAGPRWSNGSHLYLRHIRSGRIYPDDPPLWLQRAAWRRDPIILPPHKSLDSKSVTWLLGKVSGELMASRRDDVSTLSLSRHFHAEIVEYYQGSCSCFCLFTPTDFSVSIPASQSAKRRTSCQLHTTQINKNAKTSVIYD